MNDIVWHSVSELARAYADARLDPREVVDAQLARIESLDGRLGAYQAVYADEARAAADSAGRMTAAGYRLGPFHGIPFALKDIVDVENRVTTGGSLATRDRISPATATIAANLLAAGGILLGKTKTVEYAMGGWGTNRHMGTPWNPWDPDTARTPGGSSSGSGVAVAAGMASCAVGTDTGGSVRLPAAWNGIVGFKLTEGVLSTEGIMPLSHTLDTPGPMSRSVEDALLMLDAMRGVRPATADAAWRQRQGLYAELTRGVGGLRLGCLDEMDRERVDPEILALYDAALETLRDSGASIAPLTLPLSLDHVRDRVGEIIATEGYYHYGELMADPNAPMDDDVRPRITSGAGVSARRYIAVLRERERDIAAALAAMRGVDALLTPTVATVPVPLAEVDQSASPALFTRLANYLRFCALSLPMGLTTAGLPGGLQVIARGHDEATATRVGAAYESAAGGVGVPPLAASDKT